MKTVGLTGGIACGKSTVARLLESWGVPVIDADQVARDVVAEGTDGLARVVEAFGEGVLQPDGGLDRKALGAIVMGDPAQRKLLEGITHPLIGAAIMSWLGTQREAGAEVAVVEAALMVETGSWRLYDALLVVRCTPDLQLTRLVAREGMAPDAALRWIASQMPVADKAALATAVIDNDGRLTELEAATRRAWTEVLRR